MNRIESDAGIHVHVYSFLPMFYENRIGLDNHNTQGYSTQITFLGPLVPHVSDINSLPQ